MSKINSTSSRHLRALLRNRCDKIVLSEDGVFVYQDLKNPEIFYCLTQEEKNAMQKTLEKEGYQEPIFYDNEKCKSLFHEYKKECYLSSKNYKGYLTILEMRNNFLDRKMITEEELRQVLFLLSNHDNLQNCFSGRKKYELFCLRKKQTDIGHQYIIDLNKYIYQIYTDIINLDDRFNKEMFRQLYLLFTKKNVNIEEEELKEGIKEIFTHLGFKII